MVERRAVRVLSPSSIQEIGALTMLMKFTHTDCVGNVTPIYIDIMRIAIIRTVPNDLGVS